MYVKCVLALSLIGLLLRLYMITLDPFLHEWDEHFHALVARNLMYNPMLPLLKANPVVPVDYTAWYCNSIWLHKQPLFMWQMALSIKLFGISEIAIRIPSALLGSIMILLVARISLLLSKNKIVSLIAALQMCFSYYQLELTSGFFGMDHNDVAFGFYILASIWSLAEYLEAANKKWTWAILIGVFAGCAVLNKWLTGILVYAGWSLIILLEFYKYKKFVGVKQFLVSIGIMILTFLPWQLYILYKFPLEAMYEYKINTQHIFEVVQGHSGSIFYYLLHFIQYFGVPQLVFLILGLVFAIVDIIKNQFLTYRINVLLIGSFSIVFLFFSLVVKTKLPFYVFIIAPIGFIYIAIGLEKIIWSKLTSRLWLKGFMICLLIFFSLNPVSIYYNRLVDDSKRNAKIHNTHIYKIAASSISTDC
jgi:4-amino-4-deoxy-L-arabinose transferase-like glycosyltransferase